MIYVSILLATLCVQIPNAWAIRQFELASTFTTALWVAFASVPATFLATTFFAYFYGKGYETHSYPVMAVMAFGSSLLASVAVQTLVLKARPLMLSDIAGAAFIVLGITIIIWAKG